jgi:hypothetical protein
MNEINKLAIIGRAEKVDLPSLKLTKIPAKTDTGADSSSIWVSKATKDGDDLLVVFFGPKSQYYSGEIFRFKKNNFSQTIVANSFGHREFRYKIKLPVKVNGKFIKATFTLSDRKNKTYPILLGRRMLSGKFLVDVKSGSPLKLAEKAQSQKFKSLVKDRKEKKG